MKIKKAFIKSIFLIPLLYSSSAYCRDMLESPVFPNYAYNPPSDWSGETFSLSQNYPKEKPKDIRFPWQEINFKEEPEKYLSSIINYCYEGNLDIDFVVQNNSIRKWYHAPWLHYGRNGREFVRGLTRERSSRPFELSPNQSQPYNNYAVGFYNDLGGFTIGDVWKNSTNPNINAVDFPEGTVTFKLLFTTAPESIADFLTGAPEWIADINKVPSTQEILNTKVRLLQIDVAVKDNRSSKGGWVFGTFHYDSSISNQNPWLRLRPLTLMWGDDPELTPSAYQAGNVPTESWINNESPIVKYRKNPPTGVTPPKVLGWAGRGNGPVDNPVSSCMSCHSTAQIPASSPMIPSGNLSEEEKLRWFRNIEAGEAFDQNAKTLDFSLQLGVGIQNLRAFQAFTENLGSAVTVRSITGSHDIIAEPVKKAYQFTRDPDE